jgi:hypothetical protein
MPNGYAVTHNGFNLRSQRNMEVDLSSPQKVSGKGFVIGDQDLEIRQKYFENEMRSLPLDLPKGGKRNLEDID